LRWNRAINLTALALDPPSDGTVDRLFIEPLAAAAFVAESPGRWMDLGSGGGSPAIPLKIVRPRLRLTMVEARERKAAFLREAVRDLALTDVEVVTQRFETLRARSDLGGSQVLVTVRAVKVDQILLSLAKWLLSSEGKLFLFANRGSPEVGHDEFAAVEMADFGVEGLSPLSILSPKS
jgi:16S rRNA (guanine527-N7)-methyltransferase